MSVKTTARLASWLVASLLAVGCSYEDPVGVYAVVKKVYYDPSKDSETKVRVCGAFAIADRASGSYQPAMTGYMYYRCAQDSDISRCRGFWGQMGSTAGRCISYGWRFDPTTHDPVNNGEIRRTSIATTNNPDPYSAAWEPNLSPNEGEAEERCNELHKLQQLVDTEPCEVMDPPTPSTSTTSSSGSSGSSGKLFGCSMSSASHAPGGGLQLGVGLGAMLLLLGIRRRRRDVNCAHSL